MQICVRFRKFAASLALRLSGDRAHVSAEWSAGVACGLERAKRSPPDQGGQMHTRVFGEEG